MRFVVTYEDGTSVEASPAPADVLAFEEKYDQTLVAAMSSGSPRWTYFLSWHWLNRKGLETRSLEAWLGTVESIVSRKPEGEGPEGPTSAGSETPDSPTTSPASPSEPASPSPG